MYKFPINVQLTLPSIGDPEFSSTLSVLQEVGANGVELNIVDYQNVNPDQLKSYLADFDLELTKYATGAAANNAGLSLSNLDEQGRREAVEETKAYIDYAANFGIGIILGFIKGGKSDNPEAAKEAFKKSVSEFERYAKEKEIPVLVEATNRYETSIANSLSDAVAFIEEFDNPYLHILPDTFHMNIEEVNMYGSMVKYQKYYQSLHISDNNRYFPSFGSIDFHSVMNYLIDIEYEGTLAMEGNVFNSLQEDLRQSYQYLSI